MATALLAVVLFGLSVVDADASVSPTWEQRLAGGLHGPDDVSAVAVDHTTGHVVVAGTVFGVGPELTSRVVVEAYDVDGSPLWTREVPPVGDLQTSARDVIVDPVRGRVYLVAGLSDERTADSLVVAYDGAGNELWRRTVGGPKRQFLGAGAVDPATGDLYLGGVSGINETDFDYLTVAIHADGRLAWRQQLDRFDDLFRGLALSPDGQSVYVTGRSGQDSLTVAYATLDGSERWRHEETSGTLRDAAAEAVAVSPTGQQVYLAGYRGGTAALTALDSATGQRVWTRGLPPPSPLGRATWQAVTVAPDGGALFLTGFRTAGESAPTEQITTRYDSNGRLVWSTVDLPAGSNYVFAGQPVLDPTDQILYLPVGVTDRDFTRGESFIRARSTVDGRPVGSLRDPGVGQLAVDEIAIDVDRRVLYAVGGTTGADGDVDGYTIALPIAGPA